MMLETNKNDIEFILEINGLLTKGDEYIVKNVDLVKEILAKTNEILENSFLDLSNELKQELKISNVMIKKALRDKNLL